jgi:2-haloacid dehalogenase
MERWVDFDVITRDALRATVEELGIALPVDLDVLADAFVDLPLEPDADATVRHLHASGLTIGILSNATVATLRRVAARLHLPIDHYLSVDAVQRFKPHPSVYMVAADATGLPRDRIGFVTANGWDAAGAAVFGFRVAWLRREPTDRLPAVGAPAVTVATWSELPAMFG